MKGAPDEAGEVLGPLVEMGPTMRLPQGKLKCGHQMRLVKCWAPLDRGAHHEVVKRENI